MPDAPLRLSKKKFINTSATPYLPRTSAEGEDLITIGVFFDVACATCLPFWIAFQRRNPIGLALDRLCKAGNVHNTNNVATKDSDKWYVFCLTSSKGIAIDMALDPNMSVEEVAGNGDIWYVGKGPVLPESLIEEAPVRISKISSRVKHPRSLTEEHPTKDSLGSPTKAPETGVTGAHVSIKAFIAEFGGKIVTVSVPGSGTVSDLLVALRSAEPEATRNGLRIMFFEKYLKKEDEILRSVPIVDGSSIDVCSGKYLDESEMTLFLAERKLKGVRDAISIHSGHLNKNIALHWNEMLMKALMLLDSLQDVPDDVRTRRKALVKAVMAEQDHIVALESL